MTENQNGDQPTCMQAGPACSGPVHYRMALSGTGISYPRCERHWSARLRLEDDLNKRYPPTPPPDWSHDDAGEYWDEDDY